MGFIQRYINDGLLSRLMGMERKWLLLRTYHVEQLAQAERLKEFDKRLKALEQRLGK